MKTTTTLNQLIKLSFGELNPSEAEEMQRLLAEDSTLQEQFTEIEKIKAELPLEEHKPHPSSLRIILEYAHKLNEHTETA